MNTSPAPGGGWSVHRFNFWPSFADLCAATLIIFLLVTFVRTILNVDWINALLIETRQTTLEEEFRAEFRSDLEKGIVVIRRDGNIQEITFSTAVLFESASAELSDRGGLMLDRLGAVLNKSYEKARFAQVQVEGHTDNVRISEWLVHRYPTNWELSAQRAIEVCKRFSKSAAVVPDSVFSATGYADRKPVAPNTTEAGRNRNRRIEVRLVYFKAQNRELGDE